MKESTQTGPLDVKVWLGAHKEQPVKTNDERLQSYVMCPTYLISND